MWGFFCLFLFLHSANSGEDFLDLGLFIIDLGLFIIDLFITSFNSKVIINMDNPGTRHKALNNAIQM